MAWEAKTQIATALSVAGTELFSDPVTTTTEEKSHVEVEADFPASPTDELIVNLYGTLDDASENWDDTAFASFRIANDKDPNKESFTIENKYKWRLGFIRSGSTDTITVDAWHRGTGVSA